jgi:hypothetical protein
MRERTPFGPLPWLVPILAVLWACADADLTGPPEVHPGSTAVFHEEPPEPPEPPERELLDGRMTGGGSVFIEDGAVRVTHGFQLRCDPEDHRQNLQVNVHRQPGPGDRWHLEELTFAECWFDPDFDPLPRAAPINTYHGMGVGRWNGESGYIAEWIFTDEGEPGVNDRIVLLRIEDPEGTVVLEVEERTLTFGNHQAHPATGGPPNG